MGLTEYTFRNKTVIYFILVLILFGGVVSFNQLGQLEDPDFSVKKAVIVTSYPGASPKEVELEVTDRIEKAVQEMTQLKNLHSISRAGQSIISVDIRDEYWEDRLQQVWDELRRKVRDVRQTLPPGVEEPFIGDDYNFVYGFLLALTGDNYSYRDLEKYANDLKQDLGLVDGVSRVELWGVQQKVIYLDIAEQQMSESRITGHNFVSTLQQQNLVVNAGGVDVENERMRVAPTGAFSSPLDIGELYLHPIPPPKTPGMQEGQPTTSQGTEPKNELIRIKDIADVSVGYLDPPTALMRYQGKPSIGIALANRAGGNVVQTGLNIDQEIKKLKRELPAGLEISKVSWQSEHVERSINDFLINLVEAVVIVLVVLTLAMGWRMGVIIGSGLILTIFATFILMAIYKIDLHRISLGALIIALGMMVDNSIVVADGVAVRIKQGMDRTKAAIEAAKLPAIPLLGSTIIATMAFFPIYLSQASAGEYAGSLFVVVAFALIGSWLIAMTITPLQCFDILPEEKEGTTESEDEQYKGKVFILYRNSLIKAIRYRWVFTGVMIGLLVASGVGFGFVKQMFFPDSSRNQLMVDFWFPQGTRIQFVSEKIKETEKKLIKDERTTAVTSFIGMGPPRFYLAVDPEKAYSNYAQLIVNTPSFDEIDPLIADLSPWLDASYPGAMTRIRKYGVGPGDAWKFEWHITGPAQASLEKLREIGEEAVTILQKSPFVSESKTAMMNKVRRLEIDYNQVQGRWIGIDRKDIAHATRRSQDGEVVGLYRERDDLFPILLRHTERERKDAINMKTLQIKSPSSAESVPLSQVSKSIGPEWEDPLIIRWNRHRANTVQAAPMTTYPTLKAAVEKEIMAIPLPPEYSWSLRGEDASTRESQEQLIPGVMPSVVIILVILVALFNAFRPPMIILLTLPFALIGITFGLLGTGSEFGFMALLGAMSLSGMMIKNAVVLLDQINIELGLGRRRFDAVERSAVSRLRPVLLAAATTVLGMIPLIQDVFWRSMAVTIMSGLTFGTILTMYLVPVLYCILFKVRQRRKKYES